MSGFLSHIYKPFFYSISVLRHKRNLPGKQLNAYPEQAIDKKLTMKKVQVIQNGYVKHLAVHQVFKLKRIVCVKCHTTNSLSFKFQAHFTLRDLLAIFLVLFQVTGLLTKVLKKEKSEIKIRRQPDRAWWSSFNRNLVKD